VPDEILATVIATDSQPGTEPLLWEDVERRFDAERWYWLATTGDHGQPNVRPVLAVWWNGRIFSTTSPNARKGRNLEHRAACSLVARAPAIDIVVEGHRLWIDDREQLEGIATAYRTKYGWPVAITDQNMFDAPYGAPTAGNPPYRVYEIKADIVYAFGTSDDLGVHSTRFSFGP